MCLLQLCQFLVQRARLIVLLQLSDSLFPFRLLLFPIGGFLSQFVLQILQLLVRLIALPRKSLDCFVEFRTLFLLIIQI